MLAHGAPGVLGPGSTEGDILQKRDLTIIEGTGTLTLAAVRSLARAQPVGQRCRPIVAGGSDVEVGSLLGTYAIDGGGDLRPRRIDS